jgi:hypothetical protein
MTISDNEIGYLHLNKAANQNSTETWMDTHIDAWIWIYIGTVVAGGILLNVIVLCRILAARFNGLYIFFLELETMLSVYILISLVY